MPDDQSPEAAPSLAARIRRRIEVEGPLGFADYVDLALYEPRLGFYATGGRAGGRGDFLTSPEVGPLFGAVLGRAFDAWWDEMGRPDPFVVVDVGCGPGTLARAVRAAAPRCARSLRYLMVERSSSQRARHPEHLAGWTGESDGAALDRVARSPLGGEGPAFTSTAAVPQNFTGVVVANELLDNLAFDVVRRGPGGWEELSVGLDQAGELALVARPDATGADPVRAAFADVGEGWFPWQAQARAWVADILGRLESGRIVVFDYGAPTVELARRPELGWLRTFRRHERGGHPLDDPGSQDITSDVAVDQLQLDHPADLVVGQAEWLRRWGVDELVEEGRRIWNERAGVGDLEALRGRSRVGESEALLDEEGLGAFTVLEWEAAGGSDGHR